MGSAGHKKDEADGGGAGKAGVWLLLPAAGRSARMRGRDKLLEPVAGRPLLAERVAAARESAAAGVFVTLPPAPRDAPRRAALAGLDVTVLPVADADEGMAASIRKAVASLPEGAAGLAILPPDMPAVTTADIDRVLEAFASDPGHVWRAATATGVPGHPVVFPRRLFSRLLRVSGDTGGRSVLRSERVRLCPLPDDHATLDLDTPEAWAAWRARTGH